MHGSKRGSIEKYNPETIDRHQVGAGAMQRPQGWRLYCSESRPIPLPNKKPGQRSPARKSGLPDLRTKKPISGRPEIGAHFVSFNFTNAPIRAARSSPRRSKFVDVACLLSGDGESADCVVMDMGESRIGAKLLASSHGVIDGRGQIDVAG
jgi:hypothetical protein